MEKPKILVVDDEAEIRRMLKESLADNIECEISEASTGSEAISNIENQKFDLILLDIKMPGISGIDVMKKTNLQEAQSDILVLSAWDSHQVAHESFCKGAVDYITKTSPVHVICDKVFQILKKRNKYLPKPK
ncbi:MAG: response regulator [Candidatus Omnitrophota bacterium]